MVVGVGVEVVVTVVVVGVVVVVLSGGGGRSSSSRVCGDQAFPMHRCTVAHQLRTRDAVAFLLLLSWATAAVHS